MKEVKILEVEKEVLKRIDMICRFACCKYSLHNYHLNVIVRLDSIISKFKLLIQNLKSVCVS